MPPVKGNAAPLLPSESVHFRSRFAVSACLARYTFGNSFLKVAERCATTFWFREKKGGSHESSSLRSQENNHDGAIRDSHMLFVVRVQGTATAAATAATRWANAGRAVAAAALSSISARRSTPPTLQPQRTRQCTPQWTRLAMQVPQ